MKISIVTPCLNQAEYVEACLKSIHDQQYSEVEHIVIDGGSTDGSWEIIQRYRDKLAYLVSEPDEGQYYAINKGMAKATGDIQCWLNADDVLLPGALSVVNEVLNSFPDIDWVCDCPAACDAKGRLIGVGEFIPVFSQKRMQSGQHNGAMFAGVQQEGTFWRRSIWKKAGGLDLRWKLAADFEHRYK